MTEEEKEQNLKSVEKEPKLENMKKQNQEMEAQLEILMDMNNLKDESFYRRQMLMMMRKLTTAVENLGFSDENNPKKDEQ